MKKYCIIANNKKDKALELVDIIINKIENKGGSCGLVSDTDYDCEMCKSPTDISLIPDGTECALVIGGDGTIIQAARDLVDLDIPLLGINLGTLGFMAEVEISNIDRVIEQLFYDEYKIERRLMVRGDIISDEKNIFRDIALNDIVIGRSGFSRIMNVNVYINGEFVNAYKGDGVIVSTPTGSTGYNLSAGGPVIKPDATSFVITPICPHSLSGRSIVVDSKDKILLEVGASKKHQNEEANVTYDGCRGVSLDVGDVVEISACNKCTKILKVGDKSFFEIVRKKL